MEVVVLEGAGGMEVEAVVTEPMTEVEPVAEVGLMKMEVEMCCYIN